MSKVNLHQQKIKRILIFYRELSRMRISHDGAMQLMTYIFNISERWIMEILREYRLEDMNETILEHADIDMSIIDLYTSKCRKKAIKTRTKQTTLF